MKFSFSITLLSVVVFILSISCSMPAYANDRVALVIGNSAYKHSRALKNPVNDAEAIGSALQEGLGFDVIGATDASLSEMKQMLREFKQQIQTGGTALVFFAGHGLQIKGNNYLLPVEANMSDELDVEGATLPMEAILSALDEGGSRLSLVMLDCCRDNPFSSSWSGTRSAVSSGLGSIKDMPGGMMIAYATSPGKVARDGDGTHSPYATALLLELTLRPHRPLETFFKNVGKRVIELTQGAQQPWTNSKFYDEFEFAAKPLVPESDFPRVYEVLGLSPPAPAAPAAPQPLKDDRKRFKAPADIPTAKTYNNVKGFVISPYSPSSGPIDVTNFSSGTKVKCPYTGKIFKVP